MSANWLYGYKNARSDKCRLIHNAIDLDKFSYKADVRNRIRTELNVENKFVILHVGMFDNRKNHIFLIKIFYEFQKNNPDAILLLIGDGELMAEIIELVKSLQINDKVIFLGRKDNVNEFLMASDYFILPSKNEGLGIVLVEAQACGLQCLVSEAVPQEVNITGLVKWYKLENSSQEWARQIDKLAKRSNTRDQLIEGQYDIKTEAKKLADIYENLVSCHE